MKIMILCFTIGMITGCATQGIAEKSSCKDIVGEDKIYCERIIHLFR